MTRTPRTTILSLSDAGHHPAAIARALSISVGTVYAVLRVERPNRPRKPRPRTSDLPYRIRGLRSGGIKSGRIAELLECSRAFVYRVLATPLPPPPAQPHQAAPAVERRIADDLRSRILHLHKSGIEPPRIAVLLQTSRQNVHRTLRDSKRDIEISNAVAQGESIPNVASRFGMTPPMVGKIVRSHGVIPIVEFSLDAK